MFMTLSIPHSRIQMLIQMSRTLEEFPTREANIEGVIQSVRQMSLEVLAVLEC